MRHNNNTTVMPPASSGQAASLVSIGRKSIPYIYNKVEKRCQMFIVFSDKTIRDSGFYAQEVKKIPRK